jgi:signal transduction histidine kinase
MKRRLLTAFRTYFDNALDLRVRIFNILAIAGIMGAVIIGIVNLISGAGAAAVLVDAAAAALSAGLLYYSYRTQKYQYCYLITIAGIFLGLFPYLFLRMGGYHGGVTAFMVFAVVFTVFMLEGKLVLLVTALELALYTGLYIYAYRNPASVTMFPTESGFLTSNLMDFLVVSVALGASMYAQVRLYRAQQRRVDEQNAVLAQANRAKTQFLANTSHEMRTPLTVISVDIQTVMGILKRMDGISEDTETQELLQDAQAEIMRLSRMVGGMLSLNVISDSTEWSKTDFTALLRHIEDMMRLLITRQENELVLEVAEDLTVYGSADLLSQVIVNLLQNSNTHTKSGVIRLCAAAGNGEQTVTVKDNGSGIAPELLPHVFERGVTEGGSGVGLFLCKTVVESHGGTIQIESEEGMGTSVTFTLPAYQGQYGGAEK